MNDATELAQTSANAMLTAKASKAVGSFLTKHQLDDRQAAILSRAAELLERIIEGSLFIENRQELGFAPSHVGLAEYERALSAARNLNLVSRDRDLTDLFLDYRSCLVHLSQHEDVPEPSVSELKRFLGALSDFFCSDLLRPQMEKRSTRFVFGA